MVALGGSVSKRYMVGMREDDSKGPESGHWSDQRNRAVSDRDTKPRQLLIIDQKFISTSVIMEEMACWEKGFGNIIDFVFDCAH